MGDLERLEEKFRTGQFLRPDPAAPNIVDLARALAVLGDAPGVVLTPGARRLAADIGESEHLVFVLADGLGASIVEALPPSNFLRRHMRQELRTVFPSASPVALTTFATGEWPDRRGVTGWWTHLPEAGGAVMLLPFMRRSGGGVLTPEDLTPARAFQCPPLMGRMERDTMALLPQGICDSVSSVYYTGGRSRLPYRSLGEAVDRVIDRLSGSPHPTYTYLYTPRIDEDGHAYGRERVEGAVMQLESEVGRLHGKLGGKARIVISADHGLLDTPAPARHRFRFTGEMAGLLRAPPTGDARVLFFHVFPGAEARVLHLLRERFADRFLLLDVQQASAAGLLGPGPRSELLAGRFGDLIAISEGVDIAEYVPEGAKPRMLTQAAHHSGLTPAEMRVPLIVA